MARRRVLGALIGVCVLAAALRFATLDTQSLWFDESVTGGLLRLDLRSLLHAIPGTESTPPLYYVLAWLWTQLLGTSEAGMRSLSALLGLATIPAVWALARRLGGDRAGLVAAALAAVNPMLVWFSQEARSYALLTLLATLSALLWLDALRSPRRGRLVAWGAVAALGLMTHYFAVFLVVPQAVWLALRVPDLRSRVAALALPAAVGAALTPLVVEQIANDGAAFIGQSSLLRRIAEVPKQFLVGYDAPAESLLTALGALAMLVALGGVVQALRGRAGMHDAARSDTANLAAVSACALALPLAAVLVGQDHLLARNTIAVLPLLVALAGTGLAAAAQGITRIAPGVATGVACVVGLVTVVGVASDRTLQRDDWRGAVRALGPIDAVRVVSAPPGAIVPLRYYLGHVHELSFGQALTREADYLAISERSGSGRNVPPRPATAPMVPAGFAAAGHTFGQTFTVLRLRAPTPSPVPPTGMRPNLGGRPAVVLLVSPP